MTPLQRIREDPQKVRDMLAARGFDAPLDRILELDRKARDLRAQVESLNAERNNALGRRGRVHSCILHSCIVHSCIPIRAQLPIAKRRLYLSAPT